MRFKLLVPWGSTMQRYVEAEGIPPDEMYPEWFVSDDRFLEGDGGWVYPAASVLAFQRIDPDHS